MSVHCFGIRHHGPGCARSLQRALEDLSPDCVLVEGPPEAEAVIGAAASPDMVPPVAVLVYANDEPGLASFFPLASFSPEWSAIRFALERALALHLIDLPEAHDLALRRREAAPPAAEEAAVEPVDADEVEPATVEPSEAEPAETEPLTLDPVDPLDWLGRAAGFSDGESWWNQLVEERGEDDAAGLFAAIAEAMTSVRAEVPRRLSEAAAHREALREAHMRTCIRRATKAGHERIAVVCGAWHVPALTEAHTAKADTALLKGLPKVKVTATWTPWSYGRLATASGYRAGVASPGWYEYLWQAGAATPTRRTIGWIARLARFLRKRDVGVSPAHVIEAVRLAEALAAMRERPAPGLPELDEAVRAVVCMGDDAAMRLVRREVVIGERLGKVPPDVPKVPLQQDLERLQRRLRLKPTARPKDVDLDLREANDLARSHLLHRLELLGVPWGELQATGARAKGTFHEVWRLNWQPELAVALIEASRWGASIEEAATALAKDRAASAAALPPLAALVDRVLLASLAGAIEPVTQALGNLAATTGDAAQLLDAIIPLANIHRYGNVRRTDAALVAHVLDSMVRRACVGLAGLCASLDEEAAAAMRERIAATYRAIRIVGDPDHLRAWLEGLARLAAIDSTHGLVGGLAARLLFDEKAEDASATAARMSRALSAGNEPAAAAAWLEGFLRESGMVLLHDDTLWQMVDGWLAGLSAEAFVRALPLVRRCFALFPGAERRQLGVRARRGGAAHAASGPRGAPIRWSEARALRPLAVLERILGPAPGSAEDAP